MTQRKIKSIKDIELLQRELSGARQAYKTRVLICMTGCRALGARGVAAKFRETLKNSSLDKKVAVIETGCIGMCSRAPVVLIEPHEFQYGGVEPEDVEEIITETIENGRVLERLAVVQRDKAVAGIKDIDFYRKQKKVVLDNCGRIDPKRIEDAIERGGYVAAVQAVLKKKPEKIIDEVVESGLRGRGGAGFPTGLKWRLCRKSSGRQKFLICNADEGDPGAFMDRALLEGDPHRVIEGMIIAAYAIGTARGFIYVRAEYPIAVEHTTIAIEQAREYGLLGEKIAGSDFSFDIEVRMGAGAFVCGEETALIASLEGRRGMPRPRPPFPVQKGYLDCPTNINNVETLANVPLILKEGADWYRGIGTEKSKGTKIFALAGKVNNTGLVEVPMGMTLREIVFNIGGGIEKERKFKAAQLGGPSGGCLPASCLDNEIDYDSVQELGAIMGSGGLIVMDEHTCMVDVARYFLTFVQSESCGKCPPCRVGTRKMLETLESICRGDASLEDLDSLRHLAEDIKKSSLCGLGQTAPNPVLSTIKSFREEYEEHIRDAKCRAGVCKPLLSYEVTDACVGCGACKRVCPVGAVTGENKQKHLIHKDKCVKCGMCFDECKFNTIAR
ncbi:MAG: NADH-quinone oxidoreductase subunit NuoF [Planctomycetota bacterium]|jgi:NADH:ubiquinone oxidoreductase subunit F (NADH-binding)/(2Fe-2S) ferredoxin/NAD-dependent dihydropyrimidine dehydrogenase PreA subunit